VHDFGALMLSVKEGGHSIADISKQGISQKTKLFFSLFVWLALILVIAVFAYLCADTLVKTPQIIAPSLGLIPLAMLVGYLTYNLRINLFLTSSLGLMLLVLLIFQGEWFSLFMPSFPIYFWIAVLFIYSFFAAVLPVNILLQPRDYLCSFLLFFGIGLGLLGIIFSRAHLSAPAYIKWSTQEGMLWPAMFITVACGALSGFHSLIASGTTSKQLPNERHAKKIGYGAMLVEAILSVIALISVSSILTKNVSGAQLLKSSGPINLFSQGFAKIAQPLLGAYAGFFAMLMLNSFILTTLDTATRICRYLSEELFGIKNRFLSTLLVILASAILAFSGKWTKVWLTFGASNQLVASLSLFVISCWLLHKKKPLKIFLIPAVLILITTLTALFLQGLLYLKTKEWILVFILGLLILLAFFIIWEVFKKFREEKIWQRV